MAKKMITKQVTTKSMGKAQTKTLTTAEEGIISSIPDLTKEMLDLRQKQKGVKRKAHGTKPKISPQAQKQSLTKKGPPINPTEVKKL